MAVNTAMIKSEGAKTRTHGKSLKKKSAVPDSGPVVVREGSISVAIYRQTSHGYPSYVVTYYLKGKRFRQTHSDLATAEQEAHKIAKQIAGAEHAGLQLRGEDHVMYIQALNFIRPFGVSLAFAAEEYAQARQILNGSATVLEACREYARRHDNVKTKVLVADAVQKMIEMAKKERSAHRKQAWVKLLTTHVVNDNYSFLQRQLKLSSGAG